MSLVGHEGTFEPLILVSAPPHKAAENSQKADHENPESAYPLAADDLTRIRKIPHCGFARF
jgi:hypothetical protein